MEAEAEAAAAEAVSTEAGAGAGTGTRGTHPTLTALLDTTTAMVTMPDVAGVVGVATAAGAAVDEGKDTLTKSGLPVAVDEVTEGAVAATTTSTGRS